MINSIYDVLFGHLIAGKTIEIPEESLNEQSLRVQWSKFRKEQEFLGISQNEVIHVQYNEDTLLASVSLRKSKRSKSIPFTIATVEPANASTTISNDLESDQTCEGGATQTT